VEQTQRLLVERAGSAGAEVVCETQSVSCLLQRATTAMTDGWYALAFDCFFGLAIVEVGNPIILDQKIEPPTHSPTLDQSVADQWGVGCLSCWFWRICVCTRREKCGGRDKNISGCCRSVVRLAASFATQSVTENS